MDVYPLSDQSIKTTLSVDMSSGCSMMDEIWNSIQRKKVDRNEEEAPYVHPLVKRSSSLSEKSLEICTESLGSETGSDGFSCYLAPEVEKKEAVVSARSCFVATPAKKAAVACSKGLPPPLPSLAHRADGSNLQMRSHRANGRLVLEAVSVPSNSCLRAERQDGRLLLTFSGDEEEEEEDDDDDDDGEIECEEGDEEKKGEVENAGDVRMVDNVNSCVHKFLSLTRSNTPPWPERLNKAVTAHEDEDDVALVLNAYVYSWRKKAVETVDVERHRQVVVVATKGKGAAAQLEQLLRGCYQRRPSLLPWESHCIAT